MNNPYIYIGGRRISAADPCYTIAEIGVNHNGSVELAHKHIDAAAQAGADAVKFQTFKADSLVRHNARKASYQADSTGAGTQFKMLQDLELQAEDFVALKLHCDTVGLDFISTAFDPASLEFVASLKPVCLKWASGELDNFPMLRRAGECELPILLSTGMGSLTDVSDAIVCMGQNVPLVILQCISNYPAKLEDQNLLVLKTLIDEFKVPVGFSDHTIGQTAAIGARALGMSVLEKHFTLDRSFPGPDHQASIGPGEFADLVQTVRKLESALGNGIKEPATAEQDVQEVARKSLVYNRTLSAGHILTIDDITAKRPATGLSPKNYEAFLGKCLQNDVQKDDDLNWDHFTK